MGDGVQGPGAEGPMDKKGKDIASFADKDTGRMDTLTKTARQRGGGSGGDSGGGGDPNHHVVEYRPGHYYSYDTTPGGDKIVGSDRDYTGPPGAIQNESTGSAGRGSSSGEDTSAYLGADNSGLRTAAAEIHKRLNEALTSGKEADLANVKKEVQDFQRSTGHAPGDYLGMSNLQSGRLGGAVDTSSHSQDVDWGGLAEKYNLTQRAGESTRHFIDRIAAKDAEAVNAGYQKPATPGVDPHDTTRGHEKLVKSQGHYGRDERVTDNSWERRGGQKMDDPDAWPGSAGIPPSRGSYLYTGGKVDTDSSTTSGGTDSGEGSSSGYKHADADAGDIPPGSYY